MRWLGKLRAIPDLIAAFAVLRADLQTATKDPQIRTAFDKFKTDPSVAVLTPRISADWRAVEEAVNRLK